MTILLVTALCVAGLLAAGCSAGGDANRSQAANDRQSAGQAGGERQAAAQPSSAPSAGARTNPIVIIETSMGTMKAELWADKAPITVANFLRYTDEGFFNGLIFHRVIANFMIQGGGFTPGMKKRAGHEPIRNEAGPQLRNERGTLAMARTPEINSATSEFFINLKYNDFLDQTSRTQEGFGYCAFGKIIDGLDVADRIAKIKVTPNPGNPKELSVPTETIEIRSIRRAP